MTKTPQIDPLLDISKVEAATGMNRVTVFRKYKAEPPTFPRPRYIGNKRVWRLSEVEAWIEKEMSRPDSERIADSNLRASA